MKWSFGIAALLVVTFLSSPAYAQDSPPTPGASEGWLALFDGQTLSGWTQVGEARWRVEEGVLIADAGGFGWLRYDKPFVNFELKLEFRSAADGNSGVYVRAANTGLPHLTGYEIQICDTHTQFKTGAIVSYGAGTPASITPGEWQTLEVVALGPRMLVKINGKPTAAIRDGKTAEGHIGLQYTKDKKIEFRNIQLKPITAAAR